MLDKDARCTGRAAAVCPIHGTGSITVCFPQTRHDRFGTLSKEEEEKNVFCGKVSHLLAVHYSALATQRPTSSL